MAGFTVTSRRQTAFREWGRPIPTFDTLLAVANRVESENPWNVTGLSRRFAQFRQTIRYQDASSEETGRITVRAGDHAAIETALALFTGDTFRSAMGGDPVSDPQDAAGSIAFRCVRGGRRALVAITLSGVLMTCEEDDSQMIATLGEWAAAAEGQTVEFTTPGTHSWTVPPGVTKVNVVVVGGGASGNGGGSGYAGSKGGGGGLAGAIVEQQNVPASGTVQVVVGAGGPPAFKPYGSTYPYHWSPGYSGGQSAFGTITAAGGQARELRLPPYNGGPGQDGYGTVQLAGAGPSTGYGTGGAGGIGYGAGGGGGAGAGPGSYSGTISGAGAPGYVRVAWTGW